MKTAANGKRQPRLWRRGAAGAVGVLALALAVPACLSRPIEAQQPSTKAPALSLYQSNKIDKIDLLFVIDNSASMADKQKILAAAVPDLVARLVTPDCVDKEGNRQGVSVDGKCAGDTDLEFEPVKDIHIGIITSSLGSMTESACDESLDGKFNNDRGRLINRGESAPVKTYGDKGFLAWDPGGKKPLPGSHTNVSSLNSDFTNMVVGVGQNGCGYEMPLEAWYRFLVEPDPYLNVEKTSCGGDDVASCTHAVGTDDIVLQQRKDFLRQDSLLAIIMLSDENDCSVVVNRDPGQNHVMLNGGFPVRPGTPECETDPDSVNCQACTFLPEKHNDPECQHVPLYDHGNLRCFEQKRRFGWDVLYPVKRYIDGLTQPMIGDNLNPIFCTDVDTATGKCKSVARDPSLVFLGGIVGVPWQDISVDPTTVGKGYRTAEQLRWTKEEFEAKGQKAPNGLPQGKNLWDVILGPTTTDGEIVLSGGGPLDPLMKESVDPRSGSNPITGDPIATKDQPGTNPINGHEREFVNVRDDLQYACIFDLPVSVDCQGNVECDCKTGTFEGNPLCYSNGSYSTTQVKAKAYPGRRQLAVLKGVRDQAIVASVCPEQVKDTNQSSYGYRPAVAAIVDRLKGALQGTCWKQRLTISPNADPPVPCVVLEATKKAGNACPPCNSADGRQDATDGQLAALQSNPHFEAAGMECACQIKPTTGEALKACVTAPQQPPPDVKGWCYIDPEQDPSHTTEPTKTCPADSKRMIRFAGENLPAAGSLTFLQCVAAAIGS